MSSLNTHDLSVSELKAACNKYEDACNALLKDGTLQEDLLNPELLQDVSTCIQQHLIAHRKGVLSLPKHLYDKAAKYLGEITITGYSIKSPSSKEKHLAMFSPYTFIEMFPNMTEAVYWLDKESHILACNEVEAKLFGFDSIDEVVGKNIFDMAKILNWENGIAEKLRANDIEAMETGKTISVEEQHISPGGELKTFLTHKIPMFDDNGEAVGLIGISIDISHMKNKELTLQKKQNDTLHQLKTIIETIPECIYVMDEDGNCTICNDAEAQIFGLKSADELIGMNAYDLERLLNWEPGIADALRKNDIHIMKTGKGQTLEEEHVDSKGETKKVLTHKIPYRGPDGNITGVLGISFDITERKKMEEKLEAANQAKTEMLQNFRQDTRTPLHGITGSNELVLKGIESHLNGKEVDFNAMKEYAQLSLDSAGALMQFYDEVEETVRVYDGNIRIAHRKFSLSDQIEHIQKLNMPASAQKGLEIIYDHDQSIPKYLMGDDSLVRKIMNELITNAVKFTDKGYIRIQTKLLNTHDKIATIQITVHDTGPGIPDDKKDGLFEFFRRGTPSYEGTHTGIGAGLFRTKGYVESLGGEIVLDSRPGQGTTATCSLPFKIAANQGGYNVNWASEADEAIRVKHAETTPPQQKEAETSSCTSASAEKTRVLVIEDNPGAAKVTQGILLGLNCHVDVAPTGAEGVKLATHNDYDFIFMDIGLPDFSGIEATRRIRDKLVRNGQETPIVALTAHVEGKEKEECLSAGMNAVMEKPLTIQQADKILSSMVPSHSSQNDTAPNSAELTQLGFELPSAEEGLFELEEYSIFDIEAGLKHCAGKHDLLTELVKMFLDSWPDEKSLFIKAHNEQDWETIEKLAHKHKSSGIYCGLVRMKIACQYTERYRLAGLDKQLEPLYQQLLSVADETEAVLKKWLAEQQDK